MLSTFPCAYLPSLLFFLVTCVEIICLFELFSYYCILRGLCILDVGLISDTCFAHLCSQSIFILLIVSFEEQKLLVLMKSNLSFFFFFKGHVFGLASRKSFLSFAFRPMSPLELIFVCDAGCGLWSLAALRSALAPPLKSPLSAPEAFASSHWRLPVLVWFHFWTLCGSLLLFFMPIPHSFLLL